MNLEELARESDPSENRRLALNAILERVDRGDALEQTAISAIGIFSHIDPWEYCALTISHYIPRVLKTSSEDISSYSIIDNGRNKIVVSTPENPELHILTVDGDPVWTGRLHLRAFVTRDEAERWCRFVSVLARPTFKPEQEFAQTHLIYPWLY